MACCVWETLESGTNMAVIVNDFAVQHLKLFLFVSNQNPLKAAFWPVLNFIAGLCQEAKEALCWVDLLQC
jgi:hypothetical protein